MEEALALYRQILEQKPEYGPALHYSGVLAHQQGRSEEAVAKLERSLQLDPDQADCYSNLGIVLRDQGKVEAAIEACRRALALDPAHVNAHTNLGALLRATGEYAQAEAAYGSILELLRHAGLGPADLLETVEYCVESAIPRYRAVAGVRERLLSPPWPASTGAVCSALPRPGSLLKVFPTAVYPT